MKIIGICGEPGTGKTTLMREVMDSLGGHFWSEERLGTLDYLRHANYTVFGKYEGEYFDGTDRLSMAVINDAEAFLKVFESTNSYVNNIVLFEGDRLFCLRFLGSCLKATRQCRFIQLSFDDATCRERRAEREAQGIIQPLSFVRSRRTKYRNLRNQFPLIELFMNRNETEKNDIVTSIIDWIKK